MKNKKRLILLLSAVFIMSLTLNVVAHEETPPGQYITLVDENNNTILKTSRKIYIGDEYISADNSRYKVIEVIGDKAMCSYVGKEKMPVINFTQEAKAGVFPSDAALVAEGKDKSTIAIYVTHSDESYVPSDGKASIDGDGGIYDVAKSFKERLEAHGFKVQYSEENHNPNDINAYNRSRKTAATLLKKNPAAIFDVHRDAIPPEEYESTVKDKDVTQIKLVVGRTNPNSNSNLEYAKRIKSAMDQQKPGLSNGILLGKGDYNQDLSPRAMLIEVGAHKNHKEEAIEGVKQFADIMPAVLGESTTDNNAPAKKPVKDNQGAGKTIIIILVVLGVAIGGFYLLNKGPSDSNG
ncbi:MAG TPA: stage II sporulation protein P [Syntrophomonadaceae bacterium]|nr:stage II sporulation protein P [Syntrophomonadaceae bacterium]